MFYFFPPIIREELGEDQNPLPQSLSHGKGESVLVVDKGQCPVRRQSLSAIFKNALSRSGRA
jgi:hypothetical protein